jgi:hypothetical protein
MNSLNGYCFAVSTTCDREGGEGDRTDPGDNTSGYAVWLVQFWA